MRAASSGKSLNLNDITLVQGLLYEKEMSQKEIVIYTESELMAKEWYEMYHKRGIKIYLKGKLFNQLTNKE